MELKEIKTKNKIDLPGNKYLKKEIQLRDYQTVDIYQLLLSKTFVSSLATGLGKTLLTIATYTYIKERCPDSKLIVFCPRSAILQWAEEFQKFTDGIRTLCITSSKHTKKKRAVLYDDFFIKNKYDVLITSYGLLKNDNEIIVNFCSEHRKIYSAQEAIIVTYDEASIFKSISTNIQDAVVKLSSNSDRVYALSATCLMNRLSEIYGIYNGIGLNLWGNYTKFKKEFCKIEKLELWRFGKIIRLDQIVGYKNIDKFRDDIAPYFQARSKESVAKDLPSLITRKLIFDMDPEQEEKYNETVNGFMILSTTEFKVVDNPLSRLTYCQLISNCPKLVGMENVYSTKETELFRLLEDELEGEKVIIYTRFKSWVDILEQKFSETKINGEFLNVLRVTGAESSNDIEKNKKLFMESKDHNIMFITDAGSKSLNLQNAGVIIFLDTPYSYGSYLQILGRAQRIGSTHKSILVLHMINSSVDESVMQHLSNKKEIFDAVYKDEAPNVYEFTEENQTSDIFSIMKKIHKS